MSTDIVADAKQPTKADEIIAAIVARARLERRAAAEEGERKILEDKVLRLTRSMAAAMRELQEPEGEITKEYVLLRDGLAEAFGEELTAQLEEVLKKPDYA